MVGRSVLGSGEQAFARAAEAVMTWQVQRRSGVRVAASSTYVARDAVAVLRLGVGLLAVAAPVRVVGVLDEPTRRGFAYGTLPGHPESGEESFVVELSTSGKVALVVTAFSRASSPLARAAGPAGRAVQRVVTGRYLRSLR